MVDSDEEEEYFDDLTEEEREDRRRETKRFHKFFKFGLVIGTGVLAVIVFKFCVAKRRRCREMRQARRPAEVQMQPNAQPYLYNIQAPTYPQPVPFQVARPYQPQPQPPVVRGRPHDSFIRQAQPVVNSTEAQIRFHENEILRLRELRREECFEQRRNPVPITTTESFESSHPIHRQRQIPVGQPIRDDNSSFASEYPEI